VGPIENMHVNEEAHVRSEEPTYDRADEEPDDDDYDEVANDTRRKIGINNFINDYNLSCLGHLQSFNMSRL
jgi:hypothetical protein